MNKKLLKFWLECGYIEKQELFPTGTGSPQGSPVSPIISNMVLDGLEKAIKEKYHRKTVNKKTYLPKVGFVGYTDDFIVTGGSAELLEDGVKPIIVKFLAERGLELSEEKTFITHVNDGFDFLGANIRMYRDKLLTKPSDKNFKAIVDKIRQVIKDNPSMKQEILIRKLNPIIIGRVNYHKYNVSSKAFEKPDYEIYKSLWIWCVRRRPKKDRKWIAKKYFHTVGNRTWTLSVVTDNRMENDEKYYLRLKYATDTDIKRFIKMQAEANPFDENWQVCFEEREELKIRSEPKERTVINRLYKTQSGIRPVCGEKITIDTDFRVHQTIQNNITLKTLVHPWCHRKLHINDEENTLAL